MISSETVVKARALAEFAEWFRKNYPPDTVIFDPDWHAPRILRVAKYHLAPPNAEQIRAEERERCARVCHDIEDGVFPDGEKASGVAWECAAAIRSLK
jgi:hypothetical protein